MMQIFIKNNFEFKFQWVVYHILSIKYTTAVFSWKFQAYDFNCSIIQFFSVAYKFSLF